VQSLFRVLQSADKCLLVVGMQTSDRSKTRPRPDVSDCLLAGGSRLTRVREGDCEVEVHNALLITLTAEVFVDICGWSGQHKAVTNTAEVVSLQNRHVQTMRIKVNDAIIIICMKFYI
jgi:hypothetical protein